MYFIPNVLLIYVGANAFDFHLRRDLDSLPIVNTNHFALCRKNRREGRQSAQTGTQTRQNQFVFTFVRYDKGRPDFVEICHHVHRRISLGISSVCEKKNGEICTPHLPGVPNRKIKWFWYEEAVWGDAFLFKRSPQVDKKKLKGSKLFGYTIY